MYYIPRLSIPGKQVYDVIVSLGKQGSTFLSTKSSLLRRSKRKLADVEVGVEKQQGGITIRSKVALVVFSEARPHSLSSLPHDADCHCYCHRL